MRVYFMETDMCQPWLHQTTKLETSPGSPKAKLQAISFWEPSGKLPVSCTCQQLVLGQPTQAGTALGGEMLGASIVPHFAAKNGGRKSATARKTA